MPSSWVALVPMKAPSKNCLYPRSHPGPQYRTALCRQTMAAEWLLRGKTTLKWQICGLQGPWAQHSKPAKALRQPRPPSHLQTGQLLKVLTHLHEGKH